MSVCASMMLSVNLFDTKNNQCFFVCLFFYQRVCVYVFVSVCVLGCPVSALKPVPWASTSLASLVHTPEQEWGG